MLMDSTLATFLELTRTGGVLADFSKSEMVARLVNGTQILFRSADDPNRLRGINLGWFFMDEAAVLDANETWLILLARLRETPGRAWLCTTPRALTGYTKPSSRIRHPTTQSFAVLPAKTNSCRPTL